MIEKLRLRNFRCLRDVEVPLGPLNFLIGPNNTGKSSLLEAIDLLSGCISYPRVQEAFKQRNKRLDRILTQGCSADLLQYDCEAAWSGEHGESHRACYSLALRQDVPRQPGQVGEVLIERERAQLEDSEGRKVAVFERQGVKRPQSWIASPEGGKEPLRLELLQSTMLYSLRAQDDDRLEDLRKSLISTPKYGLVPERIAQPCQIQEERSLQSDGADLASCLDMIQQTDPECFDQIEAALKQFVPRVEKVRFPSAAPGKKTILFHEKGGTKVYASEASDGLLLFLAHLTIAYAHRDVGVVLIEEPETGVHPRRLRDIVHLLRAISRGELGLPPVQVIATSHSPVLVDCCDRSEIIVFQRDEGGDVHATRFDDIPDIDERLQDFGPGELIFTMGEQICGSRS